MAASSRTPSRPSSARGASASGRSQSRTRSKTWWRRSTQTATAATQQQQHADARHEQRPVGRQHGRAEHAVDHHDEDRAERDHVEQPLRDDGAEQRALARVAAARKQHHAQRLARARGQHVVAHVAHGRQRVAVAALRLDVRRARGCGASARRAAAWRSRRGRARRRARRCRPPPLGSSGASWCEAHQTTAASATRETRAWMSAKRRFMVLTRTAPRAGEAGGQRVCCAAARAGETGRGSAR